MRAVIPLAALAVVLALGFGAIGAQLAVPACPRAALFAGPDFIPPNP